jgi:hypothetical protein
MGVDSPKAIALFFPFGQDALETDNSQGTKSPNEVLIPSTSKKHPKFYKKKYHYRCRYYQKILLSPIHNGHLLDLFLGTIQQGPGYTSEGRSHIAHRGCEAFASLTILSLHVSTWVVRAGFRDVRVFSVYMIPPLQAFVIAQMGDF